MEEAEREQYLQFPETLEAYVREGYMEAGSTYYLPVLPTEYVLADGVELPEIQVSAESGISVLAAELMAVLIRILRRTKCFLAVRLILLIMQMLLRREIELNFSVFDTSFEEGLEIEIQSVEILTI